MVSPDYTVKTYAWMVMDNGHSHGGAKMTLKEVVPGLFTVDDAKFFMGHMKGYWLVRIDLMDGQNLVSREEVRVEFVED